MLASDGMSHALLGFGGYGDIDFYRHGLASMLWTRTWDRSQDFIWFSVVLNSPVAISLICCRRSGLSLKSNIIVLALVGCVGVGVVFFLALQSLHVATSPSRLLLCLM